MADLAAEFLRNLRAGARDAEEREATAEAGHRRAAAALAAARRAANARLKLARAVVAAIDYAPSPEAAETAGRAAVAATLGFDPADPARQPLLARFDPVTRALDAAINFEGEPDFGPALAALDAFGAWLAGEAARVDKGPAALGQSGREMERP